MIYAGKATDGRAVRRNECMQTVNEFCPTFSMRLVHRLGFATLGGGHPLASAPGPKYLCVAIATTAGKLEPA